MTEISKITFALAIAIGTATATARDLTSTEHGQLETAVTGYVAAVQANDNVKILAAMPPKLLARMAWGLGLTIDEMKSVMVAKLAEDMRAATIESFSVDMSNAEFQVTETGMPYAFIPAETIMTIRDVGRFGAKTYLLAILDGDSWFLTRFIYPAQGLWLRDAYPDFNGFEIPQGSMYQLY